MTWFGWLVVGLDVVGTLVRVASVGRERSPLTPTDAVFAVVSAALFILGYLTIGTGSL